MNQSVYSLVLYYLYPTNLFHPIKIVDILTGKLDSHLQIFDSHLQIFTL
jgi:hypothetical protein